MQLLICAATSFEIAPIRKLIKEKSLHDIDILITGVGLMSTSYNLLKTIFTKRPEFIIQAGIAGCLKPEFDNEIVYIKKERIGDLGVTENNKFHSIFDMSLAERNDFPWRDENLVNDLPLLKNQECLIANGVTVNEITTNPDRIRYYREDLDAGIESMEGAALHYIGLVEKIPFLQIRSVSNAVGERDKSKWQIGVAIDRLNKQIELLLSNYFHI